MRDGKKACGLLLSFVVMVGLVACDASPREPSAATLMEGFEPGIPLSEVVGALPPGTVQSADPLETPSIVSGYRRDQYFVDGTFVEVLWLHDPAAGVPTGDFRETHIPVVFLDSVLAGWGWDDFDERRVTLDLADRSTESGAMR